MTTHNFLQTLRTVKRCSLAYPSLSTQKITELIVSATRDNQSSSEPLPAAEDITPLLPDLTPDHVQSILSDPRLDPRNCLDFFKFLQANESSISFKLDLQAHLSLLFRLVERKQSFNDAESILASMSADENPRYPFPVIASSIESYCRNKPRITASFFNLIFKVYSRNGMFEAASEVFNYMRDNGIELGERRINGHLCVLVRYDKIGTSLEFFCNLVESGAKVSTISMTVVVSGLCKSGEIKRARELVEEMVKRGIKPNIVTCNILVNACAKRWQFEELDSILALMEREGVVFNGETYKLMIDGFLSSRRIEEADKVLKEMQNKGFEADAHLHNMIISRYCRLGHIGSALSVFSQMPEKGIKPNTDTYCILISGLCDIGQLETVKELLHEMQNKGINLDEATFSTMVHKYCDEGMIGEALGLHVLMQKKGIMMDESACMKIASGLCRLGRMDEAKTMFTIMVKMGATSVPCSFRPLLQAMGACGSQNAVSEAGEEGLPGAAPYNDLNFDG